MSHARAMAFWKNAEAGYGDHASDPGGATNYGIAVNFNPDVNVRSLTWSEAVEILTTRYWKRHRCDRVVRVAPLTAWSLFDFAANANAAQAKRHLQREVRVRDDGAIGPKTIKAVHAYAVKRGDRHLATRLVERRTRRQMDLIQKAVARERRGGKRADNLDFAEGWAVRFVRLSAAINRAR